MTSKGAGAIRLPSSEHTGSATRPNDGGDRTPDVLDDSASIHSRHALKVFRNGTAKDDISPLASDITMPNTQTVGQGGGGGSRTATRNGQGNSNEESQQSTEEWRRFRNRTLIRAAAQFTLLLVVCAALMIMTLYFVLPKIDDADRPALKIPRSFDQLKALNAVLQRYKDEYFFRVMFCWIVIYMFLQAFSVPGSMYMSIIAGAMWGVPLALPIVCASVATGATICYLISAYLGAVLVAMPKWKARVDAWGEVLAQHNDNMLSYLIVIRMMPLPPHNVVNILAPHLGIGIGLFWVSTFIGIFAVSTIHVTIGEKLDQMTSADDFHLFSVRNVLLLGGVIIAVLVPVFVRRYSNAAQSPLEEEVGTGAVRLPDDDPPDGGERGNVRRAAYDSESDEDELPYVRRLQGAGRGVGGGQDADMDEEGRAAYVARAWRGVEVDADEQSDEEGGVGGGVGALSDNENGAMPVFEDRREQRQLTGGKRGSGGHRQSGRTTSSPQARQAQDSYASRAVGWVNSALGR